MKNKFLERSMPLRAQSSNQSNNPKSVLSISILLTVVIILVNVVSILG